MKTTCQNLWDVAKAAWIFKGSWIVLITYIRKEGRSQINYLNFHIMKLEKEEQMKPKASRRKVIMKIRMETNEMENRKIIEKINEIRSWLFSKIWNTGKLLVKLIMEKKTERGLLITNIRNKIRDITTDSTVFKV